MPANSRADETGRNRFRLRWRRTFVLVVIGGCAGALAVLGDVFPQAPWTTILSGGAAAGVLGAVGELIRMWRSADGTGGEPEPPASPVPQRPEDDVEIGSPVFVGRDGDAAAILRRFAALTGADRQGGRFWRRRGGSGAVPAQQRTGPLVIAVTGEPGIGKSELAAQVAIRVRQHFPHGRLRCELFGTDAARAPRKPEKVLAELLRSIGAAPQRDDIPLPALRRTWRTLTRDRRLLLILDDAEDFDQVEPLLPSGEQCAVLITSTRALTNARMYVHLHPLGPLSTEDGALMLQDRDGHSGGGQPPAGDLAEIARECGGRPLSLALCRGILQNGVSTRQLLEELRKDGGENLFTDQSVDTAFRMLFRQRPAAEQLLLARLARSGLTAVAPWAAAALLGRPVPEAGQLLEELCNRHLLRRAPSADASMRYRPVKELNSILQRSSPRRLGVAQSERRHWAAAATARAIDRLLVSCAWLAEHAAIRRAPREWGFTEPDLPALVPDPRLGLEATERPDEWFADERQQIQSCVKSAHSSEPLAVEWRLQRALAAHCRAGRVYWADWRAALERTSELALQMEGGTAYGISLLERAELAGNEGYHGRAVELAREARTSLADSDERWAARAARAVGVNLYRLGDRDTGEGELRSAAAVFDQRGERWWRARTLCNLGELNRFRGDFVRAHQLLTGARREFGSLGDTEQAAKAGLLLGEVLGHMQRDLEAWLTLSAVHDALKGSGGGSWYRARCLRALGRLDHSRLGVQYEECDLVFSPERGKERRERIDEHVFRRTLGSWTAAEYARLAEEWQSERIRTACTLLGKEHWPACTVEENGIRRWSAEGAAQRLAQDQTRWTAEASVELVHEAHRLLTEAGDDWGSYRTLLILGELRVKTDMQAGLLDMEAAAKGFGDLGHGWWQARAWRHAAEALYQGRYYSEARTKAMLAIEGYRGLSNLSGRVRAQVLLGWILSGMGDNQGAMRELNAAEQEAQQGRAAGIVPESLLQEVHRAMSTVVGDVPVHLVLRR
ncbi:hypothetical protein GCM10027570_14550 [Streptomonospora sediminis]